MESVLNGETSEKSVADATKKSAEKTSSAVEGQPKVLASAEKDTLSSVDATTINNHEETGENETFAIGNEEVKECPRNEYVNSDHLTPDTQQCAHAGGESGITENAETKDFPVLELSVEGEETLDNSLSDDISATKEKSEVASTTKSNNKNNSSSHSIKLNPDLAVNKTESLDPCLTSFSKDKYIANPNVDINIIGSSESHCDDSIMLVDNDDIGNDPASSSVENGDSKDAEVCLDVSENEDSKDLHTSVPDADMSENDSKSRNLSENEDSKDLHTSVLDVDMSENDSKSSDVSSTLDNKDSKDVKSSSVFVKDNANNTKSLIVATEILKKGVKGVENSLDNIDNVDKLDKDSYGICHKKKDKSDMESETPPVLSSSDGLDLSMKPTIAHDEAQHFSSKGSDVGDDFSDTEMEPLNFSSRSNKSDLSSETKQSNDSPRTAVNTTSVRKKKKQSNAANSDNDSISSEDKLCSEDSESMDCEENSLEATDSPPKKVNDHFNALENIDKHYQKDLNESEQHETVDKNLKDSNKEGDRAKLNTSNTSDKDKPNSADSDNLVFTELSKEETGFPTAFSGLVTIGKYISVKGDFTLRSTEALVESPSLVAPFLLKEPDKFPSKDKRSKPESKGFFHTSAGEFLIGIGLSRVNEWFHRDMARIKKRQIKREGKLPHLEEELSLHQNSYSEAKKANDIFSFSYKTCETCKFTTESSVVMEGHLLVPHITPRREYQCNFCTVVNRDPREMLFHMESIHKKVGRIQPPVLFYECPFCTFESNSKVKLNSHLSKCQKFFDHAINQAPPKDFEFPALTPKPITVAVVKAYERSLSSMHRGRGRPKKVNSIPDSMHHQFSQNLTTRPIAPNQNLSGFRSNPSIPLADSMTLQNQIIPQVSLPSINLRPAHSNTIGQLRSGMPPLHLPSTNRFFQVVNSSGQILPMLGNSHLVTSPSQFPFSSNLVNSGQKKLHSPNTPSFFNSLFGNGLRQQTPSKNSCDLTITTPLPKLQGPYPVQLTKSASPSGSPSLQSSSLVVCEICDGYIKDLEQLRTHMQLIHKVKIHPKMLVSRPPLNCQKCQWRFFTDQGLERHLLGAHGLVTSNMQELANKNKDAGCCTICGRVYASKLVSHMSQVHKITLKPAHLSYKCTVCSATFNLYRLFENHVYLVHSGAAKRPSDGGISPAKKLSKSRENSDKSDLLLDEPKNHKEKGFSGGKRLSYPKDDQIVKCKDCGNDITQLHDKKHATQNEKCEKCLKSDGLIQGVKSCKDELIKKEGIEEVAF